VVAAGAVSALPPAVRPVVEPQAAGSALVGRVAGLQAVGLQAAGLPAAVELPVAGLAELRPEVAGLGEGLAADSAVDSAAADSVALAVDCSASEWVSKSGPGPTQPLQRAKAQQVCFS
jgi:hypothetical protein